MNFINHVYDQDNLRTSHNHEFMADTAFVEAYQRGVKAAGVDYNWHWRVHVGLWAARHASKLEGDFVECGVNRGFLSSSIMQMLQWDTTGRTFYLMDTFRGVDPDFVTEEELSSGILKKNVHHLESGFYVSSEESVIDNFSEWINKKIIVGTIPETLDQVKSQSIAFLHLDMNCTPPEVAAAEFFWEKLVPGAPVLLDDYAYAGYRPQKLGMDGFAASKGIDILSLPTGQGLILKPPLESKRNREEPARLFDLIPRFLRRLSQRRSG